jgi:hypothetical protein
MMTSPPSRTHLQRGVKTKNWEDRMQKTQKALSIKKLETELKEEKQAEFQRCVYVFFLQATCSCPIITEGGERSRWSGKRLPKKGGGWKRQRPRYVVVVFRVRLRIFFLLDGSSESRTTPPQSGAKQKD